LIESKKSGQGRFSLYEHELLEKRPKVKTKYGIKWIGELGNLSIGFVYSQASSLSPCAGGATLPCDIENHQ
jgi:hypothetical protein